MLSEDILKVAARKLFSKCNGCNDAVAYKVSGVYKLLTMDKTCKSCVSAKLKFVPGLCHIHVRKWAKFEEAILVDFGQSV